MKFTCFIYYRVILLELAERQSLCVCVFFKTFSLVIFIFTFVSPLTLYKCLFRVVLVTVLFVGLLHCVHTFFAVFFKALAQCLHCIAGDLHQQFLVWILDTKLCILLSITTEENKIRRGRVMCSRFLYSFGPEFLFVE